MNCPNCQSQMRETARFCTACGTQITADKWRTSTDSKAFHTTYDPAADATVVKLDRPGTDRMIGRILGAKYELLARLGEGGMGTVYRARRIHIGGEVAVKVLHNKFVAAEDAIERFRREARAAAMLHHPNVVAIHDYEDGGGAAAGERGAAPAFIVMELINGASLRELLRREGRLSVEYAVALMTNICAGVAAAHRQNIIHRDLKPDNVLVMPPEEDGGYGTAKVVDFGIAKLRDLAATNMLTLTSDIVGTPYYMSPEQCRGETLDARSDVYSLGAMMYEMLAGVRPFTSHTPTAVIAKQLTEPPPPFSKHLGVPAALEAAILRALSKDADARQADAALFSRDLRAALSPFAITGAQPEVRQGANIGAGGGRIEVPLMPPPPAAGYNNVAGYQDDWRTPVTPPHVTPVNLTPPGFSSYSATPQRSSNAATIAGLVVVLLVLTAAGVVAFMMMQGKSDSQTARVNLNIDTPKSIQPGSTNHAATNTSPVVPPANANSASTTTQAAKDEAERRAAEAAEARAAAERAVKEKQAAAASEVNVTGDWQSFYGAVRLVQSGSSISGTIRYADGSGTGRISGSITDRKLSFRWTDSTTTYNGAGTVTLSADGRTLKGSIRIEGTMQPLELRR